MDAAVAGLVGAGIGATAVLLSAWLPAWFQDRRSIRDRRRESRLKALDEAIANVQQIAQMTQEQLMAPRPAGFGTTKKLRALLYSDVSEIPDDEAVVEIVQIANEAIYGSLVKLLLWWLLPPRDTERRKELTTRLITLEARAVASARKRRDEILTL